MFPKVSGSKGSKEFPVNLVMLPIYLCKGKLTRELHAFHAPCWGQNVITYVYPHRNPHCKVWSTLPFSLPFLVRLEYTLSPIWLVRPSFRTHRHLLSEPSPCSYHNEFRGLAADYPILYFFTIGDDY